MRMKDCCKKKLKEVFDDIKKIMINNRNILEKDHYQDLKKKYLP